MGMPTSRRDLAGPVVMKAPTFPAKPIDAKKWPQNVAPECRFCGQPSEHRVTPHPSMKPINLCRYCAIDLRHVLNQELP